MQRSHSDRDRPHPLSTCREGTETLHTGGTQFGDVARVVLVRKVIGLAALAGVLAGCGDAELQSQMREQRQMRDFEEDPESIFDLFRNQGDPDRGIAVNRYLWEASLDTLSFLPIESADPFSGLIITGWGRPVGAPGAYKVTVLIADPALDARSLKVAAFRQGGGGGVPVAEAENRALEDAILTRARQLRIADAER
jgi:hypothetical protein